jgi:hypothetical protein
MTSLSLNKVLNKKFKRQEGIKAHHIEDLKEVKKGKLVKSVENLVDK